MRSAIQLTIKVLTNIDEGRLGRNAYEARLSSAGYCRLIIGVT